MYFPGHEAVMELCRALRGGGCPALNEVSFWVGQLEEGIEEWALRQEVCSSLGAGAAVDLDVWSPTERLA